MVVGENNEVERVGVEEIAGQHVIEWLKCPILFFFIQPIAHGFLEWKVHQAGQAGGIAIVVYLAPLPKRDIVRVADPLFSHDIEIGIFLHYGAGPIRHKVFIRIWVGIHPDAGQPQVFDPPDAVLDEVGRHQVVALIEVGHGFNEPSVDETVIVVLRYIGILDNGFFMVGLHVSVRKIDPVMGGFVVHPPMF